MCDVRWVFCYRNRGLQIASILLGIVWVPASQAETLRYEWKEGQKFSYEIEVTIDMDTEKTTYKGITHYTVNKTQADQANVTYRGGLSESKAYKQSRRIGFPGPPSFPSPFSRPTFAGKSQTTNTITITPRGQTLAMQGDSQLPFLLGNVSLLPFEILPEAEEKQWTADSGITISQEEEQDRFSPFGRFGPFGGSEPSSTQAGGEVTEYSIGEAKAGLVTINKSYKLFTPETVGKDSYLLTGTGTWTFDRKENIPHASDMKYSMKIKVGNLSVTFPVSVKYQRISQEKLAEMEATAKKKAEETARKAAEAKAMAERPLTSDEKAEVLATLSSGDDEKIRETLSQLATKSLQEPDMQIVAAIRTQLANSDSKTAAAASKALVQWSPEYALERRLAKDYQGPGPVNSTGLVVESITPLYVGQLVQAQRNRRGRFWFAGRIKELMPDGNVKIAFLTWGKENDRDLETVTRRNIQLAPPELPQPEQPTASEADSTAVRTWSDATGQFTVDATFVQVSDGKVQLKRGDGKTMSILIGKLSQEDQDYIEDMTKVENPFQLD